MTDTWWVSHQDSTSQGPGYELNLQEDRHNYLEVKERGIVLLKALPVPRVLGFWLRLKHKVKPLLAWALTVYPSSFLQPWCCVSMCSFQKSVSNPNPCDSVLRSLEGEQTRMMEPLGRDWRLIKWPEGLTCSLGNRPHQTPNLPVP